MRSRECLVGTIITDNFFSQTMVKYILSIKADLQGVSSLALASGANLCISVRNPVTSEVREKIVIETGELQTPDVPAHERHRAEVPSHFALKWDGEQTRSTITILDRTEDGAKLTGKKAKKQNRGGLSVRGEVLSDESGLFVPFLALECNGLEPYSFHPMGDEFICIDKAGNEMKDIDLSNGSWNTFDLSTGRTSVTNFESKFD